MDTKYVGDSSRVQPMQGGGVLQEARSRSASTLEDKTMSASQTLSAVGLTFRNSNQVYVLNGQIKKTLASAEKLLAHEQTVAQLHGSKNARLSLDGKVKHHSTLKLFFNAKPEKTGQTAMKNFIADTTRQAIEIGTPEALAKAHTILDALKETEQFKQTPKEAKMGEAIDQARISLIARGLTEGELMAAAIGDSRNGLKDEGVRAMLEKLPGLCRDDNSRETIAEALQKALTSNPTLSTASRVRIQDTIRNLQSLHSTAMESSVSSQEAPLRSASSTEKKTMHASQTLSAVGLLFSGGSQAYAVSGKLHKTLESAEKLLVHEQTVAQLQGSKNARLSLSGTIKRHSAPRIFFGAKPGNTSQTAMKNFIADTTRQAVEIGTPEALAKAHTILDALKETEQFKQTPKEAKMGEAIDQARISLIARGLTEGELMAAAIGDSRNGLKDEGVRAMLEKLPGLCRDDNSRETIAGALQKALTSNPQLSTASRVRITDTIAKIQNLSLPQSLE